MLTQEQKNLFVKRQRHMLEKYELGVCAHCPKTVRYVISMDVVGGFPDYGVCDFCAELNEIDSINPTKYFNENYYYCDNFYCPCHNYPPEEAVKRAWEAVEKWEKENK